MPSSNFEPRRAVEITAPKHGSGYRIGGRLVLTCAHLFPDGVTSCRVRDKAGFGEVDARVVWIAPNADIAPDIAPDIALVELPATVAACDPVGLGNLPPDQQGTMPFQMGGFPRWAFTQSDGGNQSGRREIPGTIYLADTSPDGLLVLEPDRSPAELEVAAALNQKQSPWQGTSGAAVVCRGWVVAVLHWHQNPNRPRSLEATPLTLVAEDPDWREHLRRHGIHPTLETVTCGSPNPDPAPPRRWFQVPFDRNHYFTGREQILQDLHRALQTDQATVISQAIRGLGGIGKTQTAIEYAYRYSQDTPLYQWVFWLKADSDSNLSNDFTALARSLGLASPQSQPEELIPLVLGWLEQCPEPWLLIFDNADEPNLLKPYRPRTGKGCILLTSRAQTFDMLGIRQPVPLTKLNQEESCTFLWERTNRNRDQEPATEIAAATDLAIELDGLPLALEQAGAYIKALEASFSAYWQTYQQQKLTLLEQQTPVMGDYPATVRTTWALNVAQVAQAHPAARSLLSLSAFLAADDIPYELLTQGVEHWDEALQTALGLPSPPQSPSPTLGEGEGIATPFSPGRRGQGDEGRSPLAVNQLLQPLADYSLIQLERSRQCYSLHRLVQVVERHHLTPQAQATWNHRAIAGLNAAFPDVTQFKNWAACARLVPHVQALASSKNIDSTEGARLLNEAGYFLNSQGRYGEAEPLVARSLAIREQQLGADHPHTATFLNNLAELYRAMGRYGEAEPLYVRSLAIDEKVYGADHLEIATFLNNLAELYRAMGRTSEAEPLYARSLAICEQQLGADHPHTATSLNNLAALYDSMGRYGEAEPLRLRCLEIGRQALGENHPQFAASLNNLAGLYRAMGRTGEAEPLFARSLAICEQQLGADHPHTATSLNNLAGLYESMGRTSEAEPLYARSLAIREQQLGADHPDTATSLNDLAALYKAMGRYSEAEPLFARSLAIYEQQLGADHPHTAISLGNLASLYVNLERYADAESMLLQALQIFVQAVGNNHPYTTKTIDRLMRLAQAAVVAGRAGELSDHPLTQAMLAQLATDED